MLSPDDLFAVIDAEITAGRYVIISLPSGPNMTHMYVVLERATDGNYIAVTKGHGDGRVQIDVKVKQRVRDRGGTDILTYVVW